MTLVGDHAVCVIFKGNRVIMCNGGAGSDSAIEDTYKLIWNGITDFLFRKGQVFKVFQLTENIEDTQYQLLEKFYKGVKMEVSSESFDDIYLKRYATALIKQQWGANLSKFGGVAMLGGVTMNGETIYSQAIEEIQRLEEQIQLSFETPIDYMIG